MKRCVMEWLSRLRVVAFSRYHLTISFQGRFVMLLPKVQREAVLKFLAKNRAKTFYFYQELDALAFFFAAKNYAGCASFSFSVSSSQM